jgi:hypothetical protein
MPFPSSPSVGDTYVENDTTYEYLGPVNGWYRKEVGPENDITYTTGSATAAGSAGEIQFTDGNNLAASPNLLWDNTNNELEVGGDINLDDGGTYSTTLQTVTPTANRVISFPDATGTVALVPGAGGQVAFNSGGALGGSSNFTVDLTWSNAGTTYTGYKFNVSSTAADAASKVVDVQVNGTSIISVRSTVPTHADNATAIAAGLVVGNVYRTSTGSLQIVY